MLLPTSDARLEDFGGLAFNCFPTTKSAEDANQVGSQLDAGTNEPEVASSFVYVDILEPFSGQT